MNGDARIVCNPEILAGKPTIQGTRLSVELLRGWLEQGWTVQMLLAAYPQLTLEDIEAVLNRHSD